ncbi:hypothetical protein HJG60_012066 [Phyllostomus discolor]|uniref:Uncharacterized protein n=1 Tax=Phyllostomus discolor TaxID=89673 RepID=A0A833ZJP8_9CHIR|nr:hypothetical protein HJG60_012066 [Phyllostomus discolor]
METAFQSRLSRTSDSERKHLGPQPQDSRRARVLEQGPSPVQGQGPGSQTVLQEFPRTGVGSLSHFSMTTMPALTKDRGRNSSWKTRPFLSSSAGAAIPGLRAPVSGHQVTLLCPERAAGTNSFAGLLPPPPRHTRTA